MACSFTARVGSSPLTRGKPDLRGEIAHVRRLIPAHAGKTDAAGKSQEFTGAHPRSRGENPTFAAKSPMCAGSSPLTRGKPRLLPQVSFGRGLIPAHAGKTTPTRATSLSPRAHPRSRGENMRRRVRIVGALGSSPLTRGKRAAGAALRGGVGLIPAHAGKTFSARRQSPATGAHPRSRGENTSRTVMTAALPGSSPLTRGKHGHRLQHQNPGGLIPAHAGKTSYTLTTSPSAMAHPRSRGENCEDITTSRATTGSSPLTRGKRCLGVSGAGQRGLIPAHAGKTTTCTCLTRSPTAHPRSRGENEVLNTRPRHHAGSSPLTRGKHRGGQERILVNGLIPAHAGKTLLGCLRFGGSGAHPRSRGENPSFTAPPRPENGSSPLTRGKQCAYGG